MFVKMYRNQARRPEQPIGKLGQLYQEDHHKSRGNNLQNCTDKRNAARLGAWLLRLELVALGLDLQSEPSERGENAAGAAGSTKGRMNPFRKARKPVGRHQHQAANAGPAQSKKEQPCSSAGEPFAVVVLQDVAGDS